MSLFKNEKKPCPICSNPTPKIFPTMIGNQPICRECDKQISMEDHLKDLLTIAKLRDHLAYREKNEKMHEVFMETRKASAGMLGSTICIDDTHQLWYIKGNNNEPILRFEELVGFTLLEDRHILERGNANGRNTFPSIVGNDKPRNINSTAQKIGTPVQTICLEIEVVNIYWQKLIINFDIPTVVDKDMNCFIMDYRRKLIEIENLTQALMSFFLGVSLNGNSAADGLIKFKQLLYVGTITQEDYNQMKKELQNK